MRPGVALPTSDGALIEPTQQVASHPAFYPLERKRCRWCRFGALWSAMNLTSLGGTAAAKEEAVF